jgi:PH domain/C2 domain of PTEN tumour-suppressor protein
MGGNTERQLLWSSEAAATGPPDFHNNDGDPILAAAGGGGGGGGGGQQSTSRQSQSQSQTSRRTRGGGGGQPAAPAPAEVDTWRGGRGGSDVGGPSGQGLVTYPAGKPIEFTVPGVALQGDILLEVYHMSGWYRTERLVRCSFSTQMLDTRVAHIPLLQLDDAASDKRFQSDFFIDMGFEGVPDNREGLSGGRGGRGGRGGDADDDNGTNGNGNNGNDNDTVVPAVPLTDDDGSQWWSNEPEGNGSTAFCDPDGLIEARKIATSSENSDSSRGATVEKGGWLTKRGHNIKNWKRRWFVLKDPTLCYYNKPRDTTPQGVIVLDDILTVLSEQNMYHDANDGHMDKAIDKEGNFWFEVITRTNSYLIRADTERDLNDWVTSIEFAVAKSQKQAQAQASALRKQQAQAQSQSQSQAQHAQSQSVHSASAAIPRRPKSSSDSTAGGPITVGGGGSVAVVGSAPISGSESEAHRLAQNDSHRRGGSADRQVLGQPVAAAAAVASASASASASAALGNGNGDGDGGETRPPRLRARMNTMDELGAVVEDLEASLGGLVVTLDAADADGLIGGGDGPSSMAVLEETLETW